MSSNKEYFSIPALKRLQQKLHQTFNLTKKNEAKNTLLAYAHATFSKEASVYRRTWKAMDQSVAKASEAFSIRTVTDFADLSVMEQANAFYQADFVVMPHGGFVFPPKLLSLHVVIVVVAVV